MNQRKHRRGDMLGTNHWKQLRNKIVTQNSDYDSHIQTLSTHLLAASKLIQDQILMQEEKTEYFSCAEDVRIVFKNIILESRHALRYILTLLSIENVNRSSIQEKSVLESRFHMILCNYLSIKCIDSKCHTLAAKILCNLGTSNQKTSLKILLDIKPSPDAIGYEKEQSDVEEILMPTFRPSSWSEIIHTTALNTTCARRETLGVVVATIHNCILAIFNDCDEGHMKSVEEVNTQLERKFSPAALATDKILMCNLVRYILPKETIQPNGGENLHANNDEDDRDFSDDATLWISLLLEVLCRYGLFQEVFHALGSENGGEGISPEQVVFLNSLSNAVESWSEEKKSTKLNKNPLGDVSCNPNGFRSTVHSLSHAWLSIQKARRFENRQERYHGEKSCMLEALKIILDILGTAFGVSDSGLSDTEMSEIRRSLGQDISLLCNALMELGEIVDKLGFENRGLKARELVVSKDDQLLIIGLVRLLGNLCYKCKQNQDLVRETIIPFQEKSEGDSSERNGLHVMLTCTSFAYGCFTLREWGIVAIRNMLDQNESNQQEVAKLEAQQVINTPELEKLGVKLDLDKKGNILIDKEGRK